MSKFASLKRARSFFFSFAVKDELLCNRSDNTNYASTMFRLVSCCLSLSQRGARVVTTWHLFRVLARRATHSGSFTKNKNFHDSMSLCSHFSGKTSHARVSQSKLFLIFFFSFAFCKNIFRSQWEKSKNGMKEKLRLGWASYEVMKHRSRMNFFRMNYYEVQASHVESTQCYGQEHLSSKTVKDMTPTMEWNNIELSEKKLLFIKYSDYVTTLLSGLCC